MKWAVEIQKTSLERRNLEDLLCGLDFALVDGIQFPAVTSQEIDGCDTAENVFEKAKQLRTAFTGPSEVDLEFVLGAVIDYSFNPPKLHYFLEVEPLIMKTSFGNVTLTVSPPNGLSTDELESWKEEQAEQEYQTKLESQRAKLEPVFRNLGATKVLELLSIENHSGETIYKIYELAEGHPNNRNAFHTQFAISKDQFNRFKDAVHNPTVSGDWARHAYEDTPKTNYPMSKGEAEVFVRQIAAKWLEYVRTFRSM